MLGGCVGYGLDLPGVFGVLVMRGVPGKSPD